MRHWLAMVGRRQLEKTWDIEQHDPGLLARLVGQDPGVAQILEQLRDGCPIASTCRPFETPTHTRLKGHARSFTASTSGGGVVVFKGTEPLSQDYADVLREAADARSLLYFSKVDWYLMIENEPFLAQALATAHNYASLAHEFTSRYAARFDALPRVPFPLAVYRLPDAEAAAYAETCRQFVTDRPQISGRERFDEIVRKGLGVLVYYYPSTPLRAAHARGVFPGAYDVGSRSSTQIDFRSAIDKWLDLVAEMLVIGYMPTANIHTGNCVQAQNLCVDGGMCDIDSLEPMTKLEGDRGFLDALYYSLFQLTNSIVFVLSDKRTHVDQIVFSTVWSEICDRVARKASAGSVDPRLRLLKQMKLDVLFDPRFLDIVENIRPHPIGTLMA